VPHGFRITSDVYRQFIAADDLQAKIVTGLKDVDLAVPFAPEAAPASIGRFFADAILAAYSSLTARYASPVSATVRPSAAAEDLLEASFAGQEGTFLNIRGEVDWLIAVQECRASLWTACAIAYRITGCPCLQL